MSRYQTLLFDADMTLFDFDAAEREAFGVVMKAHGIHFTEEDYRRYQSINAALWEEFNRGEVTQEFLQTERYFRFLSTMGDYDREMGKACNHAYLYALGECPQLLDGAEDFCREIAKDFDCYLITNGLSIAQRGRFGRSSIKPYFKGIFISEEIGYQKPRKEYFDEVFRVIGEERRENALIIGDSLSSDIAGGRNTGIDTVWFNPKKKENRSDILPTYEVSGYDELYTLLTSKQ